MLGEGISMLLSSLCRLVSETKTRSGFWFPVLVDFYSLSNPLNNLQILLLSTSHYSLDISTRLSRTRFWHCLREKLVGNHTFVVVPTFYRCAQEVKKIVKSYYLLNAYDYETGCIKNVQVYTI